MPEALFPSPVSGQASTSLPPSGVDLLAVEANLDRPHLETAGEICLANQQAGQSVAFCFLRGVQRGDHTALQRIPLIRAPEHRIRKLERLLSLGGVAPIATPRLPREVMDRANKFARSSPLTMGEFGDLTYGSARLGQGVLSSLIDLVGDQEFKPDGLRPQTRKLLWSAAIAYETTKILIEQVKPATVLLFNGRFAVENAISEAARHCGVKLLFHERGADFSRYQVFDTNHHDYRQVRDLVRAAWANSADDASAATAAFFLAIRRGDGTRYRTFTGLQVEGLVPVRSPKRRLVYFSSSDDEIAAVGDFVQHPLFQSQRHAAQFLLDWIGSQSDAELIIRVHPHFQEKSASSREWWEGLEGANVIVVPSDSPVDSYALADSADVVLSYGSTIGLEAAFMEKPSILLGDSIYRSFECCYEPQSVRELSDLLARPQLSPMPKEACLPVGYYLMTRGTPYAFYKPHDMFTGTFLGDEMNSLSPIAARLAGTKLGKVLRMQARKAIRWFGLEPGSDEVMVRSAKKVARSRIDQ